MAFPGFRPLTANFTPTPNQFFDEVLGHYPLRVVSVVGILIRSTLGWTDEVTGEKRIEAELPLSAFIRPELSENSARQGIREAIAAGFVVQTAAPTNRDGGRYALRWADQDAQREAIERQRRAVNDHRPFSDAVSGGAKFGGPNSGPQDSGGPISAPPINKRSPEKENNVVDKQNLTFNVQGEDKDNEESKGEGVGTRLPVSAALLEAVRVVVTLTNDAESTARFVQLRQICEAQSATDAWDEALGATQKAKRRGRVRGTIGAYFNGTLSAILQKRGVYVPTGSVEEREGIRDEILASLAAVRDPLTSGGIDLPPLDESDPEPRKVKDR